MKPKNKFLLITICLFVLGAFSLVSLAWMWSNLRPLPAGKNAQLFPGIQYQRQARQSPRLMVVHILKIDLRQPGLSFLVTPGDPDSDLPLKARTTSRFLEEFDLQVAVNGDGFSPWYSNNPLDFYPRAGEPVAPLGFSASKGLIYAQNPQDHPVLYITPNNRARFNNPTGRIYNAISGNPMLVMQGKPAVGGKGDPFSQGEAQLADQSQPRTAIGLDKNNRRLIIVVVDGRQPGYSEGATLSELAQILIEAGAFTAMNLDGGGSSTLVIQNERGEAQLLNSPIDNQIPGRERPVGNHLGIYATRD